MNNYRTIDYKDLDENWSKQLSLQEIYKEILKGSIKSNTIVWNREHCPNYVKSPEVCTHENAFKKIKTLDKINDYIFQLNEDNNVTKKDFEKSYHHTLKKSIDATIAFLLYEKGDSYIKKIKKSKLNKYEAYLICSYADFNAKKINPQLRLLDKKEISANILHEKKLLNNALSGLKRYKSSIVYGMYKTADENMILDWFANRTNESIEFPNFLSTSKDKWDSADYIYFKIHTNSNSCGRNIAKLTKKEKDEKEVLFTSNSQFIISNVSKQEKEITLQEIDNRKDIDYILNDCYYLNYRKPNEPRIE